MATRLFTTSSINTAALYLSALWTQGSLATGGESDDAPPHQSEMNATEHDCMLTALSFSSPSRRYSSYNEHRGGEVENAALSLFLVFSEEVALIAKL